MIIPSWEREQLSGLVLARVPAEVKEAVLKTVDDAVVAGYAHTWAYALWQVSDSRVHRWRARHRDTATLVDQAPGGHRVHALLPEEIAAILDVAERWGTADRSYRVRLRIAAPMRAWYGWHQPRSAEC